MPSTLKDIAKAAGVSTATVSRVLNNKLTVSVTDATRQRVLQSAKELGYKPNFVARNLATKGSFRLIGAIFPAHVQSVLSHPFYITVLRGIADFCQEQGYAVTVYFADLDASKETYERVMKITVDGFILTTTDKRDTFITRFLEAKTTFVHIGKLPGQSKLSTNFVDIDNYRGARLATQHLISLGHRRIATITGLPSMAAGLDRLKGYEDALHEAGLQRDPALCVEGDFDELSGYLGMEQLLDLEDRPTALFAASDAMAIGAMRALQEKDITIPDQMAVIGFDNIRQAKDTHPPLTTINQPIFQLGRTAAESLIHLITNAGQQPHHILQPELVKRKSCGS